LSIQAGRKTRTPSGKNGWQEQPSGEIETGW